MEYQIAIYSTDTVFARMLELEFSMRGFTVLTADDPSDGHYSDVVLLDLDSSVVPSPEHYRRIIGFTRGSAQSSDASHRLCSLILHRPFEMRLLRREVMGDRESFLPDEFTLPKPKGLRLRLDSAHARLTVGNRAVELSPKELQVTQCLIEHRGDPVSREALAQVIGESSANKADVYVCFLRKKFEEGFGDRLIKTVRGQGYLIP
jgi:DNA-binding response OmpR family regulator